MKPKTDKPDFSYINNADDLKKEIAKVKLRLKEREKDLEQRAKQLPKQTFQAAFRSIAPGIISTKVASSSWDIIKLATNIFFQKKSLARNENVLKDDLLAAGKRIGIMAATKGILSLLKKKRKPQTSK